MWFCMTVGVNKQEIKIIVKNKQKKTKQKIQQQPLSTNRTFFKKISFSVAVP